MPKLRKEQPIMLDDNQLYAAMLATHRVLNPELFKWKAEGYELDMTREAYEIISAELWARADEEQRIDQELDELRETDKKAGWKL